MHARLLRLRAMPKESRPWVDDLSEEYWVGRPMSAISMPSPTLVPEVIPEALPEDLELTEPGTAPRDFAPGWRRDDAGGNRQSPPANHAYDNDFEDEEATAVMSVDMLDAAVRSARKRAPAPSTSSRPGRAPVPPVAPSYYDEDDEDDEATTVMRADDPAIRRARLRGRAKNAISGRAEDPEEATVMMSDGDRRSMARRMPGVDDIRRAIQEDDAEDAVAAPDDADSIIEQARAIEQRAADRRRRSLFRK